MPGAKWATDRLVDDVARLGARGLPREEYYAEVTARLRRVVPSAAACWHTVDPGTRVLTSDSPAELISRGILTEESATEAGQGIVASEYFVRDVNTRASESLSARSPRRPAASSTAAFATSRFSSRRASLTSFAPRS